MEKTSTSPPTQAGAPALPTWTNAIFDGGKACAGLGASLHITITDGGEVSSAERAPLAWPEGFHLMRAGDAWELHSKDDKTVIRNGDYLPQAGVCPWGAQPQRFLVRPPGPVVRP